MFGMGGGGGEEEIWKKYHTTGFVFIEDLEFHCTDRGSICGSF